MVTVSKLASTAHRRNMVAWASTFGMKAPMNANRRTGRLKDLTPSPPDWIAVCRPTTRVCLTALDALITCLLPMMKPLKLKTLCLHEGIMPALESSHTLAHALKMMRENPDKEQLLMV